ncbi:arylamine N-acetyltransferase [Desulfovibrio sp. JC022]|uniref:arylamine N-acetyltransferase family protein n=1 Tax=Desulfovibrio sp. JC022 TaxID=2593642 RepID=UPI0013CFEE91|nr:arylamine N-acetyltransferase [Desulfovibrio sp. JC022]NDV23148.1 arylamine N-acetyltransferase [Desulfovibrio sp. JC022]
MKRRELVENYLRILNLHGRKSDLNFISDLVARHVATFPFCSVGCQLGDDLLLDFESLYRRIIINRRGGYCFEQNGLFFGILKELGFSPKLYLARVIYNQDIHPGLTHRITVVDYEGERYVLDVGFGPSGPRIPVPMSGDESPDGEKAFRISEGRPGEFHMQVLKKGEFFSLYRFELARYGQSDCELGHFYSHRHPNAVFVNNLVASLILEREIRSLRNLEYWVITQSGTRVEEISSSEQLGRILGDELGVQVKGTESCKLYEKVSLLEK